MSKILIFHHNVEIIGLTSNVHLHALHKQINKKINEQAAVLLGHDNLFFIREEIQLIRIGYLLRVDLGNTFDKNCTLTDTSA